MAQNIDLRHHFGAPVLTIQLPAFSRHRDDLMALIEREHATSEGVFRSNQGGGWHSRDDLYKDPDPVIAWLGSRILKLAGVGVASAYGQEEDARFRVGALWANINRAGDWNAPHHHLPADWSGVFWVDAEQEATADERGIPPGALLFIDPLPLAKQYGRPGSGFYRPKNGSLVMFPSYLLHMVTPHRQDTPRISMSFNLKFLEPVEQTE